MGKPSRDKGKRGERQVVGLAQLAGFPEARRDWLTPQEHGDIDLGEDIVTPGDLPDLAHIEVRRRETLAIPAWCTEVEEKADEDHLPVLAFRRNADPWRAALPLHLLLRILKGEH